jgi:pimeloyl-ACP methyl ester carboxylesterase
MSSPSSVSDARPALVLAPGMLSDEAVWGPQAAAFSGEFDVSIAGYGDARTLAAMAQTLLDQAPPRFALAAHSLGGRVAMEAARLSPERLTGLCLISSDPLPKPGGEAGEAETRGRYGLLALAREEGMAALADRFTPVLLHPDHVDRTAEVHAMVARQDVAALARQIEAGEGRPDHAEVLRGLEVPALLICGAEDSFGRAPLQAAMAGLLPDPPVLIIDHCGHLPTLEAPETVNQAMRGWLAEVADQALRTPAAIC